MNTLFILLLLASLVGLAVGLWKPDLMRMKSRKKVGWVFGGAAIVLFILAGVTSPSTMSSQQQNTVATTNTTENTATTSTINNQPAVPISATSQNKTQTPTPSTPQTLKTTPPPVQPAPQAPASNETVSQANAVAKAIDYLNYSAFSYEGLIAQLEYDQFSQADATYGADNSGANWDAEAAEKAKEYMNYSAFSRGGLIEQLEYDKFTPEQAEYGANAVGL